MRQVGIHRDENVVPVVERFPESKFMSRPETQLARPMQNLQKRISQHESVHDRSRPIR